VESETAPNPARVAPDELAAVATVRLGMSASENQSSPARVARKASTASQGKFLPVLVAILWTCFSPGCKTPSRVPAADLVLTNGFIYTVDSRRTTAEATAINRGKFVYVGKDKGAADYISEHTRVIDLGGRLVLPGFIDSHAHPIGTAYHLYEVDLDGLDSIEKYAEAIKHFSQAHPGAKYIKGRGWKNTLFGKMGPDKKAIDDIARDIPVLMRSEDGHSVWVNSKTLELARITEKSPDPPGGVIERYPGTREPGGVLRENAGRLLSGIFPGYGVEELMMGLESYQKMALAFGITTAHEASLDLGGNHIPAYKSLEKQNRLVMRFRASINVNRDKGVEQATLLATERANHQGSLFQTGAAKIFVDGVVEGSTAYLAEPYKHLPGSRGESQWNKDALGQMCAELNKNGFQVHVHSIGDAATSLTLNAFDYALKATGKRDSRNLITHLQLVAPRDIERFKRLRVVAVPQPYWFQKDDYYYNLQVPYLGQKRADEEYPMASFFKAGVVMASSSDYPVTIPCNPLKAIQIGITRSRPETTDPKEVLWPQERATLEQMISSFTINGAYANFLENTTGSIEVGKMADLVALDRNLFEIPVTDIINAKVLLTIFEGKEAFRDGSFK
jgi:predicted amidohydrolase YtcJ